MTDACLILHKTFCRALSSGSCGDGPEGRALLRQLGPVGHPVYLLMDRAYKGDETRALAVELGYIPVVPPKSNQASRSRPANLVQCVQIPLSLRSALKKRKILPFQKFFKKSVRLGLTIYILRR